ncbi:hypothetical protein GOBAR_DD23563 [Gossypium barbadense]|nr:hypothetical protein GOBAR_DD23563 [Gossypium barbadense]
MSLKLNSPFLGTPPGSCLNGRRSNGDCIVFDRGKLFRRAIRKRVSAEKQNDWITRAIRFSHFCGKNIELFRKTIGLRNGFVANGFKEPFAGSKALVSSLSPSWKEGLLLVRCSVLAAVMSGVCLLVWYGQKKAKSFVEAKLLPSVCSVLSEYIQREIDVGKVRGVSPLSITLEACSIGPHSEEFSCGEVPSMKIRVRPFASLRRGKIVIDAVLSHPSVLIAQKKDFTWLGIPISEDSLKKHLSTEEGIDYRTKSRRIAREEAAARWDRERDYDARKAAEMGYIVSERSSDQSKDDTVKEIGPSAEITSLKSFSCMDEKMHWRDHHCVDTSVDYDTNHAELEKSFGVKIPGLGLILWPKVIKGHKRSQLKKKFNRSDTSSAGVAAKRRILERSASAALAYFLGLSLKDSGDYSEASGSYDLSILNTLLVKNGDDSGAGTSVDISTAEGSFLLEMENVNGYVKFQNHYGYVHVQLSGNCKTWRSDLASEDGGWLSTDVFVNILDQKWHANLNISNLFVPLFERILEIPITWLKGRATGEVHLCMSGGDTFPSLHGQLDVTGLAFQIYDAPSCFSDISASLCFRGQRIFLHNTSGCFGSVPLEASGDFGIHPEEGEFHLMCQVPCVEVNALMKTFKMKPLLFPLAGSVTAVFNCQGPLTAPIFVGSGMVSRKISYSVFDVPSSSASEAMLKNKEAGAVAAFDRIPLSYLSANFTFNTDNCVADLYGIRVSLVDGGEIRGAGNAWICPEGEEDDTAVDVNFSGNLSVDKIMLRYMPGHVHLMPLKLGDLSGETKLSGSLLKPWFIHNPFEHRRFDIKWTAPKAEGSLSDARGDIMISPDCITVNSSSVAFDLFTKVQTSYPEEYWLNRKKFSEKIAVPFIVEGVELDLRMRGFEFFNLVSSYTFDTPRPTHLKATGKIKFHGKVVKPSISSEQDFCPDGQPEKMMDNRSKQSLVGDLSVSGLRLNQLMLAPQLVGQLSISRDSIKLDATGRPDESLAVEVVQPLQSGSEENLQNGKLFSFSLQKGQLKANICLRPLHSATLKIRHLPLDELELASLRGTIQRAEIQLNFLKRRGHGILSVLRPKFSGLLGEALDVAARWSGDVITLEKTVLEQISSRYELQGEYVLPGSRDRNLSEKGRGGLLERAMTGHLGSVISSMGRWRMRLEVPQAEVAEMLPLARLLSRSKDPAVRFRSKDFFVQSLQSAGLYAESLQDLLEVIHGHYTASDDVVLEDLSLPGLAELKGQWHGSLDASGGGNGDTMTVKLRIIPIFMNCEFDVHCYVDLDLRGSLAKPECDVQIRLLDGTVGGTDLGRAEVVASLTSNSRFLFNAKFEPIIQNGHVHIQGSVPVTFVQNSMSEEEKTETEQSRTPLVPGWLKERDKESTDKASEKKTFRERTEEGWDAQLAESLKGLDWNILDAGEVRIDADIKDGGMMLLTALSPYANWINGNADITLQVRGTVEQPVVDGSASFHRASIYSPVLRKPLTNIGGTVNVESNKLCIAMLESRVDTQLQITGSILQPNISGNIKLSHGEAYLPHDKGSGPAPFNRLTSNQSRLPGAGINQAVASRYVSRFFGSEPAFSRTKLPLLSAKSADVEKEMEQVNIKPSLDVRLSDLKLVLGPELRIVYPLILNFAVSGELELNGQAHPKWIKPKGILTFENGDVNLVATQVRLKREHLNLAKFEPEYGLDPMLDLALVGSEWQFRIQSRASNWQDKLVVTSTRSVEQDVLSTTEAARVFESQLAESILEGDGQLAFKKLATATLETLMPRIEGKGEFGQARWRLVYAPQIPSLLSVDPTADPLKSLASNISFGTEVEVQLGKRLQCMYNIEYHSFFKWKINGISFLNVTTPIPFENGDVNLVATQASIVRQLKDSEMAMQWTLIYQLTSRLRVLLQSAPSKRLLFEYSATSQD